MSNFLHKIEFENGTQNDSNYLFDNQSMILEFALFDRKVEKTSTGLGLLLFLYLKKAEIKKAYLNKNYISYPGAKSSNPSYYLTAA